MLNQLWNLEVVVEELEVKIEKLLEEAILVDLAENVQTAKFLLVEIKALKEEVEIN